MVASVGSSCHKLIFNFTFIPPSTLKERRAFERVLARAKLDAAAMARRCRRRRRALWRCAARRGGEPVPLLRQYLRVAQRSFPPSARGRRVRGGGGGRGPARAGGVRGAPEPRGDVPRGLRPRPGTGGGVGARGALLGRKRDARGGRDRARPVRGARAGRCRRRARRHRRPGGRRDTVRRRAQRGPSGRRARSRGAGGRAPRRGRGDAARVPLPPPAALARRRRRRGRGAGRGPDRSGPLRSFPLRPRSARRHALELRICVAGPAA